MDERESLGERYHSRIRDTPEFSAHDCGMLNVIGGFRQRPSVEAASVMVRVFAATPWTHRICNNAPESTCFAPT